MPEGVEALSIPFVGLQAKSSDVVAAGFGRIVESDVCSAFTAGSLASTRQPFSPECEEMLLIAERAQAWLNPHRRVDLRLSR